MSDAHRAVIDWLINAAPADDVPALVLGLVERLTQAGVPLDRLATNTIVVHPELETDIYSWTVATGVERGTVTHEVVEGAKPGTNVTKDLRDGLFDELRFRPGKEETPYAALRKLALSGTTDYLARVLTYTASEASATRFRRRGYVSFATSFPGGFSETQLDTLRAVCAALALRMHLASALSATRGLLEVYLGHNAAQRVLAGGFRRGAGEIVRSAIWYCDLRGFTTLVDNSPVTDVVQTLDRYFDAVARPVIAEGGEILKFIGDAVLAIFPVREAGPSEPCRAALAAAVEALHAVERLSAERSARGQPQLRIGVALHLGEVMYGNIGAIGRLDFTVIGAAVNEVCRVEALCKELGVPLLLTGAFARTCGSGVVSLGRHALRGVAELAEVATIAPFDALPSRAPKA